MNDFASSLLSTIRQHRLPGLDADGFVYPHYDGLSILNIPSTVCQLLDIPGFTMPPLREEIVSRVSDDTQNVIVILMDALAFHRLQNWMASDESLIWNQLAERGVLAPITSITPSTTAAAITTLWTASPPQQHGITGYEMWLKEYGVIANMIEHKPITYWGHTASLTHAGFDPETFLPVESVGPHFTEHGVAVHVFQHYAILNSGLSKTFLKNATLHGINTPADLWVQIRDLMEQGDTQRKYIWVYWGALDRASHLHGPDHAASRAEFVSFSQAFQSFFFDRLSASARQKTVVILAADHGQIATRQGDPRQMLQDHEPLLRMLHMNPTGENRLAYLYIRPGYTDAVRDYIEAQWPGQFHCIEPQTAVESGLFGPGVPHHALTDRVGDLIVAARGDAHWWWANRSDPLIGRHGGLHEEEMIVPFLMAPL